MRESRDQLRHGRRPGSPRRGLGTIHKLAAGAAILALSAPATALAQATPAISTPTLGNVAAAASGVTTFRFSPAGAVTKLSGNGTRISTGSVEFQVTITCGGKPCGSSDTLVKIGSIGTPTGRAGSLTNFTVSMLTAKLVSGPTTGNPITFTIGPIGQGATATFTVGADFPIKGDDTAGSTGAASSGIYITASATSGKSATTSNGAAAATVFRSLSLTNTAPLDFGRIVRPPSSTGSVILAATTGARSVSGGAVALSTPTPSRAAFVLQGEGGQAVSVSVPTTVVLANAKGDTLTVATSRTAQGTQLLSGGLGAGGSLTFYVGGAFSISPTTSTGAYTGSFVVIASYN